MGKRRLVILTAILALGLGAMACEGSTGSEGNRRPVSPYATPIPHTPSARELAAIETVRAEETTAAMEARARATADALEIEGRATRQALDLRATQEAQEIEATRRAWEFAQTQEAAAIQATAARQALDATATRQAIDATATATREMATATAEAIRANVEATRQAREAAEIQATTEAIQAQAESERATDWLRTYVPWVLAALVVVALGLLGWRIAKVAEDRARVIRRQADEAEPFIVLDRERLTLPLRSFGPYIDATHREERAPLLAPTVEAQDAATMRQQTANAIQARQVGQIAKAKSKAPKIIAGTARALPGPRRARRRRRVPGLVRVVSVGSLDEAAAQGVLPPRLARVIEGEWRVVDEEDQV